MIASMLKHLRAITQALPRVADNTDELAADAHGAADAVMRAAQAHEEAARTATYVLAAVGLAVSLVAITWGLKQLEGLIWE